ncbi:hypothetical protein HYALB_00003321 [Hymenoscyphus albidus]|uniref:Uncharacterized protein n=1 Tax=Hymenoscyphus albidus TaxID=595503 RepID=A0A9N9PR35_9HELO|nr:hypothetical protein HYALB_00003321 [Hymenoscyphus albidus]
MHIVPEQANEPAHRMVRNILQAGIHSLSRQACDRQEPMESPTIPETEISERIPLIKIPEESRENVWGHIKRFFLFDLAEFFDLETALAEGKRRGRWKCRCGKRFYHDSSWDLDTTFAFDQDPATDTALAEQAGNETCSPNPQAHGDTQRQYLGGENTQYLDAENSQDAVLGRETRQTEWIVIYIPYQGIAKVIYIPVPEDRDDLNLFDDLRKEYFNSRGWWSRFKNLKAVRNVHFQLMAKKLASINESEIGLAVSSRGKLFEMDTLLISLLKKLRLTHPNRQADQVSHNHDVYEEDSQDAANYNAVFISTPKKLGSKSTISQSSSPFPEGWGLYLEEGFHVSWYFFAILGIYLFASLACAIAWNIEYKSGPQAGLGSFGVASWMAVLFALSGTTWFAAFKD